jgi:N-glycosylase/DNA lyase
MSTQNTSNHLADEEVQQLFADVARFVADSRVLLAEGAVMELAGLDERVRVLCEKAEKLSPEERTRYADMLTELLQSLTALGQDMRSQQDAIMHEIRYLSSHKKASVAYKTADATDGFKKPEN